MKGVHWTYTIAGAALLLAPTVACGGIGSSACGIDSVLVEIIQKARVVETFVITEHFWEKHPAGGGGDAESSSVVVVGGDTSGYYVLNEFGELGAEQRIVVKTLLLDPSHNFPYLMDCLWTWKYALRFRGDPIDAVVMIDTSCAQLRVMDARGAHMRDKPIDPDQNDWPQFVEEVFRRTD